MKYLRSLWFNVIFYFAVTFLGIGLSWVLFFPRKTIVKIVGVWLSSVAWIEKHLGGIDYRVVGLEHLPKGACIVACKHQSAWETYKMHLFLDDPAVVLKKELLSIPFIGWYMKLSGSIPIDRAGGARSLLLMVDEAKKAVAEERPIVIYPEGTRVKVGESRPYKSGVIALYRELNVPLVPVALNSGLLWPKNSFFKSRGTITVEILPPIPPGLSREEMMNRLRDAIEPATARLLEMGAK